jgi:Zn-dependent protease with chaperone function
MDFFKHQEVARKKTTRLVVLYMLAVLATIVLVYLAVATFLTLYETQEDEEAIQSVGRLEEEKEGIWRPDLLLIVGGATLLLVAGATFYKISDLSTGGDGIAKALGGRLLNTGTNSDAERKVMNVVEEMAIAAGIPCPSVYLLDREKRINAFAAGYAPENAVIGITAGCAEQLTRDELQGVVAHEFSHILNGDMRLNIRLIGLLHGILVISLIGGYMLRAAFYSGGSRSSRRDGGTAAMVALGFALMLIGWIGMFFGNLIKAAVSRQREYLADASAVSFTRQSSGIGGALKKIGGTSGQARMAATRTAEFSHMFFGSGIRRSLFGAMATHPPMEKRIRRIDPKWDGTFDETIPSDRLVEARKVRKPDARPAPQDALIQAAILGGVLDSKPAGNAVDQVGRPSAAHLAYAIELRERLPEDIKEAVHEPRAAQALIYALLLDDDEHSRGRQMHRLREHEHPTTFEKTRELRPLVKKAGEETRLPLLDLAIPALRTLSAEEFNRFRENANKLIESDDRVEPFEWLLRKILLLYLEPQYVKRRKQTAQYYNLTGVRHQCAEMLSVLAHFGHADEDAALTAFQKGSARMELHDMCLLPREESGVETMDRALAKLTLLMPGCKKTVLQGCAACIGADAEITVAEGEFFRGIADVLDCPMPPLLPGQKLA